MRPARSRQSSSCANTEGTFPRGRISGCTSFRSWEDRRAPADAYAALGRIAGATAVLDASAARPRRRGRRLHCCWRHRAGAVGWHRPARHTGRDIRRNATPQRAGRDPRRSARCAVSGCRRHALRRGPDRRSSRAGRHPSVVLMNPPFSVMANVSGRVADAAYRHVASALARLADGGRLVAITGANFSPDHPVWAAAFVRLQERGRIVFTAAVDGSVYAKHGTTIDTRLTVIDKLPTDNRSAFPLRPASRPTSPRCSAGSRRRFRRVRLPPSRQWQLRRLPRRPGPFAETSRALLRHVPPRPRPSSPKASNSPMRPWSGRLPKSAGSPTRSMKNTDCRRSVSPGAGPSDQACAIRRDGLGRAAQAELPAPAACKHRPGWPAL